MKDLNAHLMSDFIKVRIGFVRKWPIENEEEIEDLGYSMIPWKEYIKEKQPKTTI